MQEAAAVVCCFRYWEKGSSGEGELFAIYIFISVIDAQLAFVSFMKGYWEGRAPSRPPSAGRMSGCPVVPMNDDPMKTARGCHPSIIQLDNRASEQRGTFSSVQMCKCPYGMLTFTRKKRLAELVGAHDLSVRFSLPSTV